MAVRSGYARALTASRRWESTTLEAMRRVGGWGADTSPSHAHRTRRHEAPTTATPRRMSNTRCRAAAISRSVLSAVPPAAETATRASTCPFAAQTRWTGWTGDTTSAASRSVSRVLYAPRERGAWRPSIYGTRRRVPPAVYPQTRAGRPQASARAGLCPALLDLAPGGVYRAAHVTVGAGALLPHRFTLTAADPSVRAAVCSLWHCPAGHPGLALPTTLPCGARTFLEPAGHPAGSRPPDRLAASASVTCAAAGARTGDLSGAVACPACARARARVRPGGPGPVG